MINDLVTIVVPVYNSEKNLDNCLLSILNQTYTNLEIILVNDGSMDNSLAICENYKKIDQRVKVIDQPNLGVSSARNNGIKNASGKYIQFVDSDDRISSKMVEVMVNSIQSDDSDLVICGIEKHYINHIKKENIGFEGCCDVNQFIKNTLEYITSNIIGSPCNKIYKLNYIKKYGILFDEDVSYAEDLFFNYDYISKIKKITILNDYFYKYYYMSNNTSLSSKFRVDCFEHLNKIYHETIRFLNRNNFNKDLIKDYFANLYISLIKYFYRKDNPLSNPKKRNYINSVFESEEIKSLIFNSNFTRYNSIIIFLVQRKMYLTLELLFLLINIVKKSFIYKFLKKVNM